MHPALNSFLADARQHDLVEQGARARLAAARRERSGPSIVVRLATPDDQPTLDRLAALDSHEVLADPALIGEIDNHAVAAVSLSDGDAIADPFVPTTAVLEVLRLRARQLSDQPRSRRRRWRSPASLVHGTTVGIHRRPQSSSRVTQCRSC